MQNSDIFVQFNNKLSKIMNYRTLKLEYSLIVDILELLSTGTEYYSIKERGNSFKCCLRTCRNDSIICVRGRHFPVCREHYESVNDFLKYHQYISHDDTLLNMKIRLMYLLVFKDSTSFDHARAIFVGLYKIKHRTNKKYVPKLNKRIDNLFILFMRNVLKKIIEKRKLECYV